MNENDKMALDFLMNMSTAEIYEWYGTTSAEDHVYALQLLKYNNEELADFCTELVIETRISLGDLKESQEYLSKFFLNKG